MGANNGTGRPCWFCCSACRKRRSREYYGQPSGVIYDASNVTLTGRSRACRIGTAGCRNSTRSREYICKVCGHKGWSRHTDLEDLEAKLC